MSSCGNESKAIPHILFFQVQCFWFHVEIFDLSGVEFSAGRQLWIHLHSSTFRRPVWPALFVKDAVFFFSRIYFWLIKNQVFIGAWIYVWVFNSKCLFLCQYHALFFITIALLCSLRLEMVILAEIILLIRIVLAILGLFVFPHKAEHHPFKSREELC